MLRVSSQVEGQDVDLKGVVERNAVESGVPYSSELIRFAEVAEVYDQEHDER